MRFLELVELSWPPAVWADLNIAIALSGGADSVALLKALHGLKQLTPGKGKLFALHVNHHLRGIEADEDQHWCEELCNDLCVPLEVLQGNVLERAKAEGDGLEAAARTERYQLLKAACESLGCRYLVTAHTRDDQVETLLFRLFRGTGLYGLTGINSNRALSPTLTVVRPLLDIAREEILIFLKSTGQTFRTDSSNRSRTFTRNRIRHELLPLLRSEYNSDVDGALLRLSCQAKELQSLVDIQARELLNQVDFQSRSASKETTTGGAISIDLEPLWRVNTALVRETLRMLWRDAELPEQKMTFQWWQKLAELAVSPKSRGDQHLPGNITARISEGRLYFLW